MSDPERTEGGAAAAVDRSRFVAEMRRAMQLHQAGRFADAAEAYGRALAQHPEQPDALNYSGYLAHQMGDSERGLALIERSIALSPDNPGFLANRARVEQALGRLDEAVESYRKALALEPENTQLHTNLGIALTALGRYEEAVASLETAAKLDPSDARPLTGLGSLFQQRGQLQQAARCFRKAIEIDPNETRAQTSLAATLKALGRPDKAAQWYKRCLAVDPRNAKAQSELGALLAERGRLDDAVAAYRRALEIEPRLASAYLHLSAAKRFAPGDADLAAMERLLADPATPEAERAELQLAVGKAYEDLADYDRAFAHFADGKRLLRAQRRPDPAQLVARIEAIAQHFDAALFERNRGAGSDSPLPVFLIGPAGAGLALLEAVLAAHPTVHGGGALPNLRRFALGLASRLGLAGAYPDCVAAVEPAGWAQLAEAYLAELAVLDPTAARITDRAVEGFLHVGLMQLLFPRAAIVELSRDPLDAGLWCYRGLPAGGIESLCELDELGRNHRLYQRCMAHWHEVLPGRLLTLRYEELLAEPEASLRRLLEHCGLDWDEACLAALLDRELQQRLAGPAGLAAAYAKHLAPLQAALAATD